MQLICSFLTILEPAGSLLDQPVHIHVDGLRPAQVIELKAIAEDVKGEKWISHVAVRADEAGRVALDSATPLPGSTYSEVDGMGLFWSMESSDISSGFRCKNDAFEVEVELYVDNALVESAKTTRYLKAPDVKVLDIQENGLVGKLFVPPSDRPLPVIITLSGSNGGLSENRAKLLASNGFAVLALGYFGVEGLPSNLQEIPLEYFETAIAWLKNQKQVDGSRIGIYGVSRGGELALVVGSLFSNDIRAIAAVVPSSVVYGGLRDTPVPAWLWQGKPISPSAPISPTDFSNGMGDSSSNPANSLISFMEGMKESDAFEAAKIPVEKIQCPLLVFSGGDDKMWPSELFCKQIAQRASQCKHWNYPDAGHTIMIPNLPQPGPLYYHPHGKKWFSVGGTRQADHEASVDSWAKLVTFFHEALGASTPSAVVFDWGDVIAFSDRAVVVRFVCDSLAVDEVEFETVNLAKRKAMEQGVLETDFWIQYAKSKGISLPANWAEQYIKTVKKSVGVDEEMVILIDELKEKQIRVGLLSNINDRYTHLIRSFGFYELFDPCLLSYEIGLEKPDPKIYELLLQQLNLPAKEVVFIDDKLENVEAAKAMGIDAIVFESAAQIREELKLRCSN